MNRFQTCTACVQRLLRDQAPGVISMIILSLILLLSLFLLILILLLLLLVIKKK